MPKLNKGVYQVRNVVNGKVYVGSTTNQFKTRWYHHKNLLKKGSHYNKGLQADWNKHGETKFVFEALEHCFSTVRLDREDHWIKMLEAWRPENGYNVSKSAYGWEVGKPHSEETKTKLSQIFKGIIPHKATEAAAIVNRGKKRPPHVSRAISLAHKGCKRTEETKERIKAAHWSRGPNAKEIAERTAAKNRGKKHSEEHKKKIRESVLAAMKTKWSKENN